MSTYLGAVGIGVSSLETSEKFYTDILGMQAAQTIEPAHMKEIVMAYPGSRSAAVVLMHYTDNSHPNYQDNPVKLVFYVEDAAAVIGKIKAAGYPVVSEAKPFESMGGALIGFGKDPDGYLIELVQKPAKK